MFIAFSSRLKTTNYKRKYRGQIVNPHYLTINRHASIVLDPDSHINLNAPFELNAKCERNYRRSTIVRMAANSLIEVNGAFRFFYGADVQIHRNGVLTLGESFINSDCKIRCVNSITIGNGCAISHDVTILDSDFHKVIYPEFKTSAPKACH